MEVYSLALAGIIVAFGIAISRRLKVPSLAMLVLLGMLVGPNGLGWVKESETIRIFAELGAIMLLFSIGMRFHPEKILKFGFKPIFLAIIRLSVIFSFIYHIALFLGFPQQTSIFLGITLTVMSTIFSEAILRELKWETRVESIFTVAYGLLEDILIVFSLATVSSIVTREAYDIGGLLISGIKSFLFLYLTYSLTKKLLSFLLSHIHLAPETQNILAFSLALIFSLLSINLGFSPAVGAYVAGAIIACLPRGREIEESMKNLLPLFTSFFFFSTGMLASPYFFTKYSVTIFLLLVSAVAIKFIVNIFGSLLIGFSLESSVFISSAFIPIGELSLLVALYAIQSGIFVEELMEIVVSVVVITPFISSLALQNYLQISTFFQRLIQPDLRKKLSVLQAHFSFFLEEINPHKAGQEIVRILLYLSFAFVLLVSLIFLKNYFNLMSYYTLMLGTLSLIFYLLYIISKKIRESVINYITRLFYTYRKAKTEGRLFILDFFFLILLLFSLPFLPTFLGGVTGSKFISLMTLIFLLYLAIVYLIDALKRLPFLRYRKRKTKVR